MHRHTYSGQTLRHDHEGGDQPHGYFGHPEDNVNSPDFGAGTYELASTGSGHGIAVTGQQDIDQAAAEIAVALRDGDPGKRDQHYYDEAARLRDAIMAGTRALAATGGTPLADSDVTDALAGLDALRSDPPGWGLGPQHELAALRDLEQAVRKLTGRVTP